ncbi:MAG: hypothetical protein VX438_17815 [Planctomycetota bacterium]|nr:hypothetical protein [Planctomycetota bacterium]
MKLIIGTDEAGYGPNLGPLVVTASCWLIDPRDFPTGEAALDLFTVFERLFCRTRKNQEGRIQIGDSKQIYQSRCGLAPIERAVIPIFLWSQARQANTPIAPRNLNWSMLVKQLCENATETEPLFSRLPWYQGFDPVLPTDLDPVDFLETLQQIPETSRSFPWGQRSRIIEAGPFNRLCEQLGNKANVLSHTTLSVISNLLTNTLQSRYGKTIDEVLIVCDKHGGRNHYGGILQSFFEDCWIQVVTETREHSRYRFRRNDTSYQFDFYARGESHLPIAVSSLFAKYVREICMIAFNRYWHQKESTLLPTAGYPQDAKRFRQDIQPWLPELGIPENDWWRIR